MGRKPIPDELKRRTIGYSLAPETPKLIQELGAELAMGDGRVIDEAVRELHRRTVKRSKK